MEKEEFRVAAKWWGDQLRGTPKQDNGDAMTNALVKMLQEKCPFPKNPEDKIRAFEDAIVQVMEDRISDLRQRLDMDCWDESEPDRGGAFTGLGVDYGPCVELQKAADLSGVDLRDGHALPMKTHMWIRPGSVRVSCGYRAPIEQIYAAISKAEGRNA